MTTEMQLMSVAVLDEPEAIVQAESLRLTPDWGQWERELAEFLAVLPWPRPLPAGGGNTTTEAGRRPTAIPPKPTSAARPVRRSPATTVLATQRSPPAATPGPKIQRCSRVEQWR